MSEPERHKILVVDDEEAILETMAFTFEDEYEVLTSTDAEAALAILDEHAPVAVVLTDQRMPNMTGVEFLARVYERHPTTVRMILTGFADMEAIIRAINDGHVYAYVTKPWESDQLKQVMKRAVDHHVLAAENARLLEDLKRESVLLQAAIDELDTGALAVDARGVVRASNRLAGRYLGLGEGVRGRRLEALLSQPHLKDVGSAVWRLGSGESEGFEEVDVGKADRTLRLRLVVRRLTDPEGLDLGAVVLLREVSHEPLRRRLEDRMRELAQVEGDLRPELESWVRELSELAEEVRSGVDSPGMLEIGDLVSRSLTAAKNWLDVDAALAEQDYPDAQVLADRMRVALARWPCPDLVPERVRTLGERVEAYYESGENPRQRTL